LKSENGTFANGDIITPGLELEVKEGVPIAIGMCMICLGEEAIEQLMPFVDPNRLTEETAEQSGIFAVHRDKTNQKKLEFLYKVSKIIDEYLPINETLEKILGYIFDLLKRIDRVAFILVNPETEKILKVISRSNKPGTDMFCIDVVKRVIKDREPVKVSDVASEEDEAIDTLKIMKIGSVMCVPIISSSQIVGVIYVDSLGSPYGFRKDDLSLFMDLSQRIAPAVENARFASWSVPRLS
jgi:transcriptional regulator with GAF, ATPase, and Fis domain